MRLRGKVTGYVNGKKVFESPNTIKDPLKAYFRDVMGALGDKAIDNLFTAGDVTQGSTQDGKDGIVCVSSTRGERTMLTTTMNPSNTYGKKWRGEYVNSTGANETITDFQLGFNFNSTVNPYFATPYADYNPTDIVLADLDTLVIEWEVYIA